MYKAKAIKHPNMFQNKLFLLLLLRLRCLFHRPRQFFITTATLAVARFMGAKSRRFSHIWSRFFRARAPLQFIIIFVNWREINGSIIVAAARRKAFVSGGKRLRLILKRSANKQDLREGRTFKIGSR